VLYALSGQYDFLLLLALYHKPHIGPHTDFNYLGIPMQGVLCQRPM